MTETEMLAEAESIACAEDWDSYGDKIRAIAQLCRDFAGSAQGWTPQADAASEIRTYLAMLRERDAVIGEAQAWRKAVVEAVQKAADNGCLDILMPDGDPPCPGCGDLAALVYGTANHKGIAAPAAPESISPEVSK